MGFYSLFTIYNYLILLLNFCLVLFLFNNLVNSVAIRHTALQIGNFLAGLELI